MGDTDSKNSYGHVLKYIGIFGGVQGLNILVSLVRNKLVALILGPGGMGLVSLFNSTITFLSQATNLGLPFSAVKHISEVIDCGDSARIERAVMVVRMWSLATALVGMLLCAMLGPLLSDWTFSWGDHTLHFVLLSPVVAMLAITGGEAAILKGARKLRALATIQVCSVVAALLLSVPIYYFYGMAGIVPVLLLLALVDMAFTMRHSLRHYPYSLRRGMALLGQGRAMVRLGVAFVLTGIMGSGAEMLIRSFLNVQSGLDTVGLYNAGFVLTVTYAGMVFSAMETDYFPRLAAVHGDAMATNLIVNRQVEVSLLVVAPMLAVLILTLPLLMPLLYSSDFTPVIGMAQVAALSMYFKAVSLPMSYITLARGDSVAYFILEGLYDLLLVAFIVVGYHQWGLFGTGVAITVSYVVELAMILCYVRLRYRYVPSAQVLRYALLQLPLGAAAYAVTHVHTLWLHVALAVVVVALSVAVSAYVLYRKTSLWQKLRCKWHGNG